MLKGIHKVSIIQILMVIQLMISGCTVGDLEINTYQKIINTSEVAKEVTQTQETSEQAQGVEDSESVVKNDATLTNENDDSLLVQLINQNKATQLLNNQNQLVMNFESYDFDYKDALDQQGNPTKLAENVDYSLTCTSWLDNDKFKFERVITKYQDNTQRNPSNLYFEADLKNEIAISYEYRLDSTGNITDIKTGVYLGDYYEYLLNLYQQQILDETFMINSDSISEIQNGLYEVKAFSDSGRTYVVQYDKDNLIKSIKAEQGLGQFSQIYTYNIVPNVNNQQSVLQSIDASDTDLQKIVCKINYKDSVYDVTAYSQCKMFISCEDDSKIQADSSVILVDSNEQTSEIPNNLDFYVNAPMNFEIN